MPSPETLGGSTVAVHLYVDDVDAIFAQAIDAGALDINSVEDQFYGDRTGTLQDPFGHIWFVGTHKEDLSMEEIEKRAKALFA
jgi:PhnB protein